MFQNILVIFQKTLAHRNEKYFVWINTQYQEKWCYHLNFFLIGIHYMQGWTVTAKNGITRKRSTKRLKQTGKLFREILKKKGVY